MNSTPSVRSIREALVEVARQQPRDPVAVESLRADVQACVLGMRRSIDRAFDFASRGLVGESASIIEDFPDLVQQANALYTMASSDATTVAAWNTLVASAARGLPMPTADEVDRLAGILTRAEMTREHLDTLRAAVLRQEPLAARLRILRRLRAAEQGNRMWLDQIESLERDWLRRLAEMSEGDLDRAALETAVHALDTHEWVAAVPRGLRDSLVARLRPLRALDAASRYASLADEIHEAASMMDRAELERLEVEWASIERDTGRMPDEAVAARVAPAFEWLTRAAEEDRAAAAFDALVEKLERALDERREPVEVERHLAALRDAGRSAPEGVVRRAEQYLASLREESRRRGRFIAIGSIAAAAVVTILGGLAIRAYALRQVEAEDLAMLRAAIDARDGARAELLAGVIRAKHPEPSAALAAALEESARLAQDVRSQSAAREARLAAIEAELGASPARARLATLKDAIAAESGSARAGELERARIAQLSKLDARDSARVDEALAASESALRLWPLPDRWSDAEQVDAARWDRYDAALGEASATLEACARSIAGYAIGEQRLSLAREGLESRRAESATRREALGSARRELSPERLAASVTDEADLVARLEAALSVHGATLARTGQLAGFEAARDCAAAWSAIRAWRTEHRPRLVAILGDDLAARVAADRMAEARAIVDDHLAKHASTPMRDSLELLAGRLAPQAAGATLEPLAVMAMLESARIAGIEEVPLVDGRRFYRRPSESANPSPTELNPLNRAIVSRADLVASEGSLRSILEVRKDEIAGAARPSAVSRAWSKAQSRLAVATAGETGEILLELAEEILASSDSDPLMRFVALEAVSLAIQRSGSAPEALERGLAAWRRTVASQGAPVAEVDWLRAAFAPPRDHAVARDAANALLAAYPKIAEVRAEARETGLRFERELGALAPIGVLAPAAGRETTRSLGSGAFTGPVLVVGRTAGRWRLVEVPCSEGRIATAAAGIPEGPVVVYRRITP